MSTESESGWSREWPSITGYYWRRINEQDYPSLVRIVGDECRFTDGSHEGRYECYQFLGPLSPADTDQLVRLREAARDVVQMYGDAPMPREVAALRHALGAQEGETR